MFKGGGAQGRTRQASRRWCLIHQMSTACAAGAGRGQGVGWDKAVSWDKAAGCGEQRGRGLRGGEGQACAAQPESAVRSMVHTHTATPGATPGASLVSSWAYRKTCRAAGLSQAR